MKQIATDGLSWIASANEPSCGFPLGNLPYCAFVNADEVHLGVGIGASVLDLHRLSKEGHLRSLSAELQSVCLEPTLNALMELDHEAWAELRDALARCLHESSSQPLQSAIGNLLLPMEGAKFAAPVRVGNYTDFYASIEHATNVGRLFRPDQPLLPNYKYVPIGYHGRVSSLVQSGTPIRRPHGQIKVPDRSQPEFRPCTQLDYELEVAGYIGSGNLLGTPIPVRRAEEHLFGFSLMNDWSARDIQSWEYQPLGPFLGKNFGTTLSPWVVTKEALRPYRVARADRAERDPQPLEYLDDDQLEYGSGIDMTLEVYLSTQRMRSEGGEPWLVSSGNLRQLYWSFAQMIAHNTSNGCNLMPGDVLGSGTVSGPTPGSEGSLLERTRRGQTPLQLGNGEVRSFLEDGDEVILRGFCKREGFPRISLGECRGTVQPAILLP